MYATRFLLRWSSLRFIDIDSRPTEIVNTL